MKYIFVNELLYELYNDPTFTMLVGWELGKYREIFKFGWEQSLVPHLLSK